jgi:hypothetical protein
MNSTSKILKSVMLLAVLCVQAAIADDALKPYIMTTATYESIPAATAAVTVKLSQAGFQVAGQYTPFEGALVMGITSDTLRSTAAKTEHGGFGAAIRVSITQAGDTLQIAYVNPAYMAAIYRMESLAEVSSALATAFGEGQPFGSEKGRTAAKLAKYHYMMAMPYFDDLDVLAHYDSHADAVANIEKNLAAGVADTVKVYRVDVTGKEETLFGVGLRSGDGSDQTVMANADLADTKHTAHLPYELLVSGSDVIALRGRFRIAQSFPDLTMGTFMKIRSAPGAIKNTLKQVAQP